MISWGYFSFPLKNFHCPSESSVLVLGYEFIFFPDHQFFWLEKVSFLSTLASQALLSEHHVVVPNFGNNVNMYELGMLVGIKTNWRKISELLTKKYSFKQYFLEDWFVYNFS